MLFEDTVYGHTFTDARTDGRIHNRRQTKCDHKSLSCHYVTDELKMSRLYRKNDHKWSFFYIINTFLFVYNTFSVQLCLFVLRFYSPVNPMGSCRARSVYLTTRLLGRLSPLMFIFNPSLAKHNMCCLSKQCRSRSVSFWISTVCH